MNTSIQATTEVNELATLLIPVNGKQLVLPNVTVAEIISYQQPEPKDDTPDWFLGHISWRNMPIPLVSFETINDEPFTSQSRQRRVAVLNGLVDEQRLPFCAIVTEGVPRLMRVMSDEVAIDTDVNKGPGEVSRVLVNGEKAAIPDVDYIQQEVLKFI
jgi:chemosensory pili system protein ChpC